MQLIIEDLEWQLEGADKGIEDCERRIAVQRRWLADAEEELNQRMGQLVKAINHKEELQQALEVLRSHESQEQS